MSSIDLRNLRCFLEVCASGSISKAAEQMHLAQPAMSMQIKGLEEALGLKVFVRTQQGVQLTPAGTRLRKLSIAILTSFDSALEEVRQLDATPSGTVCVGLPQSMAKLLTVPLVREVLERWPEVRLQVAELSTGYIPEQLLLGKIDLGITFQEHANPGLRYAQIARETLVLIAPPGRLSKRRGKKGKLPTIDFFSLEGYPLILPAPEHGLRILLDGFAASNKIALNPIAEVNAIHQLIDVVSSGVGCSLLSYASVMPEVEQGRLSAAEIVDPSISRPVFLARRSTIAPSIAVSCVVNLLNEIVARLIESGSWPATFVGTRPDPG